MEAMPDLLGKHVLVTGAAGFIGANLVRRLLDLGATVSAPVRSSTNLWRLEAVIPQVNLLQVDLGDGVGLKGAVETVRPELIFHLAIPFGHPSIKEQTDYVGSAITGTANLLAALRPVDFHRLICIGSSLEYGFADRPLRESDRLEPATVRGVAKAATSLLCRQFARAENRSVVVLRPFSVYGPWEAPTRLIPRTVVAALGNRQIDLTGPGYRRDPIFVEDLVDACLIAAQSNRADGEIFNIASGRQFSNKEIVEMIMAISGRAVKVNEGVYPPSPSDTDFWEADIQKAKSFLGWEPRHTLRGGLEKTIAWIEGRAEYEA